MNVKDTELIYDNGVLRDCDKNVITLGYWGTLLKMWGKYGYISAIKSIDYERIGLAVITILSVPIVILLFPFLPFIQVWDRWQSAKKFEAKIVERFLDR